MTHTVVIRANLTADEWAQIRVLAIQKGTKAAELVASTLRDALLKGSEQR